MWWWELEWGTASLHFLMLTETTAALNSGVTILPGESPSGLVASLISRRVSAADRPGGLTHTQATYTRAHTHTRAHTRVFSTAAAAPGADTRLLKRDFSGFELRISLCIACLTGFQALVLSFFCSSHWLLESMCFCE